MSIMSRIIDAARVGLRDDRSLDGAGAFGHAMASVGTGIQIRKYFENWSYADSFRRAIDLHGGATGQNVTDPYRQSGPYKRGVDAVAKAVRSVPWRLFPAGDSEKEVTNGRVWDLFRAPNPTMSRLQLFVGTVVHLYRDGEAVWAYDKMSGGVPGEVWLLNPRWLTPKTRESDGLLQAWEYRNPRMRRAITYPVEETTHFKNYNPDDPIRGLPIVTGGLADVDFEFWAKSLMASVLAQGGHFGDVFSTDKDVPPETATAIMETILARHGGPGKALKPIMLEKGFRLERAPTSPRDMQYEQQQRFSREETAGNTGVPPLYMGILEFANYANARVQERIFWTNTVIPLLDDVTDSLGSSFFARFAPDIVGMFDTSGVTAMKDAFGEKVLWVQILEAAGWPINAISKLLDLGFDPVPWGDDKLVPFSMVPARLAVGQTLDDVGGSGSPAQPRAIGTSTHAWPSIVRASRRDASDDARFAGSLLASEERRTVHWRGFVQTLAPIENQFGKRLRVYFTDQRREVLNNLANSEKRGRGLRKQDTDSEIDSILFDLEDGTTRLRLLARPFLATAMETGAGQILADLDVDPFDIDDSRAQAAISTRLQKVTRINETTRDGLREALREGLTAGESISDLAARVRGVFEASSARSRMIARTEIAGAANEGKLVAAQEAGLERHEWLSARDDAVRDDHVAEDGNVVRVGAPFPVTNLLYPLDSSGPPEQVVNCRCTTIPALT